jgi:type I restriction enzyme M protein
MVALLNAKWKMVTVIPHGVLFRSGAEGQIRAGFIKDDLIEAVIGLPTNIFYGASIPAALLVINKSKPIERKHKILFNEASSGFIKDGNKNKLREDNITRIIETFDAFIDVEKFAKVVDLDAVKTNDCNLNISRYVDTATAEEEIDIISVIAEIREIKEKTVVTEAKLNEYLSELGYDEL